MRQIGLGLFVRAIVVALVLCVSASAQTHEVAPADGGPYVVESYYAAKWGFAGEFFTLFKKNYFPVLEELRKQGRVLSIEAEAPRYHIAGDGRWDLRVRIVWRDAVAALDEHPEEIVRRLFPDQETYKREEQRRFEVIASHWDVPVEPKPLVAEPPAASGATDVKPR